MPRLPLTLIEQYFFAESKTAHPCWIHYRFHIRGRLFRDALREAWRQTVSRHPTLHSIVCCEARGTLVWETAESEHEPSFVWKNASSSGTGESWTPIDITSEPAVRLTAVAADGVETCEITLEGHHAIFDGLAMFDVAHDLFLTYARQLGSNVQLPELQQELFPARGKFGLSVWQRILLAPKKLIGLGFAWQLHRRDVSPLNPVAATNAVAAIQSAPPTGFPVVLHHVLPPGELEKLRSAAQHADASLNDLFIRDVQAAIGVWRAQHNVNAPEDWIYVTVPVNLRHEVDSSLPAANMIGLVQIDRQARSLTNRPRLLRRAREDMNLVKRHRFAFAFLTQLAALRMRPGGIARYCDAGRCRSTVVLTNLGVLFSRSPLLDDSQRIALPGALVEDCVVTSPVRPGTAATIAVSTYGGRLAIDVHVDPRALSPEQAATFLTALLDQLRASAEEATPA